MKVENDGYEAMMERCIRALGRRVVSGDVEDLARMQRLRNLLDDVMGESARGLHAQGESWANIGRGVGMTRQAAQQRWSTRPYVHSTPD